MDVQLAAITEKGEDLKGEQRAFHQSIVEDSQRERCHRSIKEARTVWPTKQGTLHIIFRQCQNASSFFGLSESISRRIYQRQLK
jgi:hypothetical protein